MNLAFKTYYEARRNIRKYRDAIHKQRMKQCLDDIATTGWGTGVTDMKEAYEHVYDNVNEKYLWDDTTTTYASFPGWKQLAPGGGKWIVPSVSTNFPSSIVNFVRATKGELSEMNTSFLTDTFPDIDKVINAFQKSKYNGVVEVVKEIHKQVKNVDKFLWVVPEKQQLKFGKVSKAFSYTSTLTTFNKALDDMQKYKSAGFNSKSSAALAALRAAMGCVPVLGGFYGALIDQLPSFVTKIKQGFASRQQKILDHATLP